MLRNVLFEKSKGGHSIWVKTVGQFYLKNTAHTHETLKTIKTLKIKTSKIVKIIQFCGRKGLIISTACEFLM